MGASVGSLVDGVLNAWERALTRRDETGWAGAETARAALAALRADAEAVRSLDPRLALVGERFGLDEHEHAMLAVAAVVEAHPAAYLLSGLLSGDGGPGRPTVALAWESVGLGTLDPRAHVLLAETETLRGSGLLRLEGDAVLTARRVLLPDRVAAHLLGSPRVSEAVAQVLAEPRPVDVDGVDDVAGALSAGERLVWVHAPVESAGAALAVAAARRLDVAVLVADLDRVPGTAADPGSADEVTPGRLRALLQAVVLEAGLEGALLVLLGAQRVATHLDLLTRSAVPVVAVARTPWDPRWADRLPVAVTAGRLTREERAELWRHAVGADAVTEDLLAMRVTPEEIDLVGERVRADADADVRGADHVRAVVRQLGAVHRSGPNDSAPATLADLVLPDHTRREVERLIGWARDRDEVLAIGDLQGKGGKGTGICALFSGSPGTGKTLAAHVVANSLGADLYQVELASVVDKYIGETEKNLDRIFGRAETMNAVLFFDEADALFGQRSAVNDARDRYANQEVAYLLQRMEVFEGITVLATNLRGNLDPAFARRLHFMVHFPDPDAPTRRRLWEHHLAQLPGTDPDDPVDLDLLVAALEVAGGDIRNVVLAATYDAVAERRLVGMTDLRRAADREMAKLGRRISDTRWPAPPA